MFGIDNVAPKAVSKFIPEIYKGKKYVTLAKGDEKTIVSMARNVYQAKNADFEPLVSTIDGTPIMKKIIYIGFDDGSYSSIKTDIAVAQLESIVDDGDETNMVWTNLNQKVKVIETKQSYGRGSNKKDYPVRAFEPIE